MNLFAWKKIVKLLWLLPGFLLWASFPPMGEQTDVLFALAPLLWVSRNADVRTSVRRWTANGLLFWLATLAWFPAIVKNGGPAPLVVLGWFGLAAYCSLFFAAFGWLSAKYWRWTAEGTGWRARGSRAPREGGGYGWRLFGILVVEPVLWAGLEIVRSRFLGGFAWNQLGVAPINAGLGAPAALGGVYLVSALVILVNGTFAGIAERVLEPWLLRRRKPTRTILVGGHEVEVAAAPVASAFANVPRWARSVETLLPLLLVLGAFQWAERHRPLRSEESFSAALVQRNFPCVFQRQEQDPYAVYSNLLSHVALLKPDVVVLSESALCEIGPADSFAAQHFAARIREQTGACAVLTGGSRRSTGKEYNSAALYAEDAREVYDKVHLVPFGEFIPGDKLIPALQKLAPVGSCTPGELKTLTLPLSLNSQPSTLNSHPPSVPVGVAICFEDTDSAQMRALAKKGARALFFITNDSWFSHSDEAVQHSWQAVARAIETGLPVVRVGNSGVSGVISPAGRAMWVVGADGRPLVDARGTLCERVRLPPPGLTPYVRFGDVPLFAGFAVLLVLIGLSDGRRHRAL